MHQQRAHRRSGHGEHARRLGIDALRALDIGLGLVHRGVGSGVDDHVRDDPAHRAVEAVEILEVTAQAVGAATVERHDDAERRERALQFPADLAVLAQQQDLHPCTSRPA